MLLNEMNLKALCVSAESVLPVEKVLNVEGYELTFKITAFQSGYGSGKKTVVSGMVSLNDANHTSTEMNNSDIETIRRKVAKLLGLKNTTERKTRTPKEMSEVDKLRQNLAVARRLPKEWIKIDAAAVWKAYQDAKYKDRQEHIKRIRQAEVTPLLKRIEKAKLSDEARALLLASLQ